MADAEMWRALTMLGRLLYARYERTLFCAAFRTALVSRSGWRDSTCERPSALPLPPSADEPHAIGD